MNTITLENLLEKVTKYNPEEVEKVKKAYYYAEKLHQNQYRQSGEPYIIHPLNVAYILTTMHADGDTICAGLLHDTIEDTDITKEDITHNFNEDIASLVDGVTKISKMNFSCKEDENTANTTKIITSITEDIRIIIIKLADRLHNMRTLEYKSKEKQIENSEETLTVFANLAYYIGAYRIKDELEDLSLKYIDRELYDSINEERENLKEKYLKILIEMKQRILNKLKKEGIEAEIKFNIKNIYNIYTKTKIKDNIEHIPGLFSIKVIVPTEKNCFTALGIIHSLYMPYNIGFKDYINHPKINKYRSLQTLVCGSQNKVIQVHIRTKFMDLVDKYGLTTYWYKAKGEARYVMQQKLKENFQFYNAIIKSEKLSTNNSEFLQRVYKEILTQQIYIYLPSGENIEMPKESSILDFVRLIGIDINNATIEVNEEEVSDDYILKNEDRVTIIPKNKQKKLVNSNIK